MLFFINYLYYLFKYFSNARNLKQQDTVILEKHSAHMTDHTA